MTDIAKFNYDTTDIEIEHTLLEMLEQTLMGDCEWIASSTVYQRMHNSHQANCWYANGAMYHKYYDDLEGTYEGEEIELGNVCFMRSAKDSKWKRGICPEYLPPIPPEMLDLLDQISALHN